MQLADWIDYVCTTSNRNEPSFHLKIKTEEIKQKISKRKRKSNEDKSQELQSVCV